MPTYEEVYQDIFTTFLNENISTLKISLDEDPEVKEKVESWCKRHDFPYLLARYAFHTKETFRYEL